jgi:DUF438 domain-containing protein
LSQNLIKIITNLYYNSKDENNLLEVGDHISSIQSENPNSILNFENSSPPFDESSNIIQQQFQEITSPLSTTTKTTTVQTSSTINNHPLKCLNNSNLDIDKKESNFLNQQQQLPSNDCTFNESEYKNFSKKHKQLKLHQQQQQLQQQQTFIPPNLENSNSFLLFIILLL